MLFPRFAVDMNNYWGGDCNGCRMHMQQLVSDSFHVRAEEDPLSPLNPILFLKKRHAVCARCMQKKNDDDYFLIFVEVPGVFDRLVFGIGFSTEVQLMIAIIIH